MNSSLPANSLVPSGIADYLRHRDNGEVLAVVEAKEAEIDPRFAQAQAEYYVTEIAKRQGWRPFAFLSNGQDTYFVDGTQRRLVHGFFSKGDLDNQLFTRRSGVALTGVAVKPTVVNRGYQLEAVRLVASATLPRRKRSKPSWPCVSTTIRSQPLSSRWLARYFACSR